MLVWGIPWYLANSSVRESWAMMCAGVAASDAAIPPWSLVPNTNFASREVRQPRSRIDEADYTPLNAEGLVRLGRERLVFVGVSEFRTDNTARLLLCCGRYSTSS